MHRDQIGRDGRVPKHSTVVDPAITPGMKRATSGELAAWHHGIAVQDEPNVGLRDFERKIPLHPATPPHVAAQVHSVANDPNAILKEAATLGPKVK
jgi:hypothetical protein